MKTWSEALRDALWSGAFASLASTAALSIAGLREKRSPLGPTNVISRWIWGDRAARHHEPSLRYTATGYAIHHASSTLWALVYEKWMEPRVRQGTPACAAASGLAMAAMACFTDYKLTPYRLEPGFDKHLSKPSMAMGYLCFGLALALRSRFVTNSGSGK
jgi:hypothetical protein